MNYLQYIEEEEKNKISVPQNVSCAIPSNSQVSFNGRYKTDASTIFLRIGMLENAVSELQMVIRELRMFVLEHTEIPKDE